MTDRNIESNDIYDGVNEDKEKEKVFYGTERSEPPNTIKQETESDKIISEKISETINQNKKLYICEKCGQFPIIRRLGNKMKITCTECKQEKEMELSEYYQTIKYEINEKNGEENKKYKFCNIHKEKPIIKVCINCKKNLCEECCNNHKNHQIKEFKELDKEIDYLKKQVSDYINESYLCNDKKEEKNSNSNSNTSKHYKIKSAIESIDKKGGFSESNTIFEQKLEDSNFLDLIIIVFSNMKEYPSYSHYENIRHFCSIIGERLELTYNINNINNPNNKEPNLKIKLLGKKFVENNKDNCSLIINGEIGELKEEYQLTDKDKDNLNIILLKEKDVTDMSYMFYGCENLKSISDNSKWKTDEVTDLSYMFYNCSSLEELSKQLKYFNTSKVKDMTYMLYGCKLIPNLDVTKWDTSQVENMGYLFNGCEKLSRISGISQWATNKVDNMCFLFADCIFLEELREIFNWNTSNVTDMSYMFYNCKALKFITNDDTKTWDTKNVTNMSNMFNGCESIEAFPNNIFQWDTSRVQYMSYMFGFCKSLTSISEDIVKWDMKNVLHMNSMFEGCEKLEKLPAGITDWKIDKLVDINEMIEGCDALKDDKLPDFSKWKDKKIVYKGGKKFAKFFK